MNLSRSSYWSEKISDSYECGECGGCVRKDGTAPIAKGSVTLYKCIRCGSTGKVKDRLRNDPQLRGLTER